MKTRNVRKVGKIILGIFIFMLILTITVQARIVVDSQKIIFSGISGSAYYNRVEGHRNNSYIGEYLYSGIRRTGGAAVFGKPVMI